LATGRFYLVTGNGKMALMPYICYKSAAMKKLLLILSSLLALTALQGQTNIYQAFPKIKALWSQIHIDQYGNKSRSQYGIFPNNDTVIGLYTYHKLFSRAIPCGDTNMTISNSTLAGGLREDSLKRIYYYPFSFPYCPGNASYKLYDFSKQTPGDTIQFDTTSSFGCYNHNFLTISSIDSVLIDNGSYRKQYHFVEGVDPWLEGFGSLGGLLSIITPQTTCLCTNKLTCYFQDDSLFYFNHTYNYCLCYPLSINNIETPVITTIFPNPTTGKFTIETSIKEKQNIEVVDLNGRLVFSQNLTGTTVVDVNTLNEGVYTLSIKNRRSALYKKLVIVK
jgi:hypothetical protein